MARLQELTRASRARFVVIRGEAGIGKTALWRWAVATLQAAGHRVLVTRPAEEEMHGPMTGLLDLFEGRGPEPGALEPDVDRFDRGRAVLRTLRRMAGDGAVVVAVDDVQWLDAVTARALRYAVRRLDSEPVVVVVTDRTPVASPADVVPPDRAEEVVVGPLRAAAVIHLVRTVVGTLPRPTLERIAELSAGNPMYAIELARSAEARSDRLGSVTPPTLRGVLAGRLGDVPDDLLAILRTAAALGPAPMALLDRGVRDPGAATLIHDAVDDGLLVAAEDGTIRFAHPLLASVVLDGTNPLERRALHAALASTVDDPDAKARHLALSCSEPDETVASAIAASAERAGRRGAAAVAADLADHSVRLTPAGDVERTTRRKLAAISHRAAAGEPERALAMTDELLASLDTGPGRLEAITLRVFLDIDHGEEILARAIEEAGTDQSWRGRLVELLGWLLATYRGQLAAGIELGWEAMTIATQHRRHRPGDARRGDAVDLRAARRATRAGTDRPRPAAHREPRAAASRSMARAVPRPPVPVGR